jgi:hypothetical protein
MTTCPTLTPAQQAAAKPWAIAIFSSWAAGALSILTLGILMLKGVSFPPWAFFAWVGLTLIAKRLIQMLCNHQMRRIVGDNWKTSARADRLWLAADIAIFTALGVLFAVL